MTETGEGWAERAAMHRLLLRLAGRVPDEFVSYTRKVLCDGDLLLLSGALSASLAQLGVSVTPDEFELLRGLAPEAKGIELIPVSAEPLPPTGHVFSPVSAEVLAVSAGSVPLRLDLSGGSTFDLREVGPELASLADLAMVLTDDTDQETVNDLSFEGGVVAVRRAWRFAASGAPVEAQRVFLIEAAPGWPAWDLTGSTQVVLGEERVRYPQVETYWSGDELSAYHKSALENAALLWTAEAAARREAAGGE
ncbi:hypothetical protein [Actinoplanes sp. NPDC051494]|uniref:hypothetical protein n=1 Tax=Actinoplanes sp. NPDC051494 TaxID=3363907 RepID=UPI0037BBAC34